jgi:hypothetical protein
MTEALLASGAPPSVQAAPRPSSARDRPTGCGAGSHAGLAVARSHLLQQTLTMHSIAILLPRAAGLGVFASRRLQAGMPRA